MVRFDDWNGRTIKFAASKGGVVALAHPYDNLIKPDAVAWPPPEIVQKLYKSRQQRAFADTDVFEEAGKLGYYCDLQSIHSEDAITWSVFGPVKYADQDTRDRFADELLAAIGIEDSSSQHTCIWLWTRVPHPDNLVPGGPEIDFGLMTDDFVILGEAKWRSSVGKGQGVSKTKDQMGLRREFLENLGGRFYGDGRKFIVLSLQLKTDSSIGGSAEQHDSPVLLKTLTWDQVCGFESHPDREELGKYFAWKKEHSQI